MQLLEKIDLFLGEGCEEEEEETGTEYKEFFQSMLKKFGVSSPAELKGDKKKEFFDEVDKGWKAKSGKSGMNEGTKKDDYKKILKVINSVQTKEHAQTAENMIDNFGKWYGKDEDLGIFDMLPTTSDLKDMLKQIVKRRDLDYKVGKY